MGLSEAQIEGLKAGRKKGTNRRNGRLDTEATKAKKSGALKAFFAEFPEVATERGKKLRGELNRQWKGGSSKLNTSIRLMAENRRWMDGVKARDGHRCTRCLSTVRIESHHLVKLGALIAKLGIKDRDDARKNADVLWNLGNGIALCEPCHYAEHGRRMPS